MNRTDLTLLGLDSARHPPLDFREWQEPGWSGGKGLGLLGAGEKLVPAAASNAHL